MPNNEKEVEIPMDGTAIPNSKGSAEISQVHEVHVNQRILDLGKDMSEEEFLHAIADAPDDMLIPWEPASLPSGGVYYEGWSNGTVQVRAMTQSCEKAFANRRLIQTGEAIDKMFRHCVQLPGNMPPEQLLVGDRTFLLYYIRGITFGNLYKFTATCPSCNAENMHTYDMNELYATVIPANVQLGPEPFKVVLPHLSKVTGREMSFGLRFLRAADINSMMAKNRFQKKLTGKTVSAGNRRQKGRAPQRNTNEEAGSILNNSLEKSVVSVNNSHDPMLISRFTSRLHSLDNAAIRDFLQEYTPGIDSTVNVECGECGNAAVMELPITEGFFRAAE